MFQQLSLLILLIKYYSISTDTTFNTILYPSATFSTILSISFPSPNTLFTTLTFKTQIITITKTQHSYNYQSIQYMRIIILLSIAAIALAIDCQKAKQMTCILNYDRNDFATNRQIYFLSDNDQLIIKIISPLSLLTSLLIILFYSKVPGTREQPGDIILGTTISQIFLVSSYLATVIYNSENPLSDSNNIHQTTPVFCSVTGYLIVLSFCAEFVYNISFCIFFIVIVKNVLKSWQKEKWIVHVICIVVIVITGIVLLLSKQIGVSLFGLCGLKVSKFSPFFRASLIIVYFSGILISSIYFKKHIPQMGNHLQKKKLFSKYYFRYIIAVTVNLILQTTCDLIAAISCQSKEPSCVIRVAITLSNSFSILNPIITFGVMCTHPDVRHQFHSLLIRCFGENKNKRLAIRTSSEIEDTEREVQMQQTGLLANMLSLTRSRIIYSILCAIVIEDRQVSGYSNLRQINEWNYKDKMTIKVDEEILKDFADITLNTIIALDVQIISYCPRVFKTLMKSDGFSSIANFLNPKLNVQQIQNLSQSDGGKSGQFFFFSSDNQIILKTLTKKELDVLLSRLQAFVQHYSANPNSLITKVYGLYTLTSLSTGQEYHLFVMKNLSGCPKKFISRTYDLKGSKFDRKVIKQYDGIGQKIDKTMKDLDFLIIEERLYLDYEQSACLKEILIQDSLFLRENRLIDYSLIVMKMQLGSYLQEKQMLFDQFRSRQVNPYAIVPCTKQSGVAYVMGIIDYLQTWTTKKKGEKLTKVLLFFKFKNSDDVSAQAPQQYCERFIKKVVNTIV